MAAPRFKDSAKNAFVKTNLFYTKNPFLGIQDPTVFGFKLFFHFDNMSSPLLYGATRDINEAPLNTAAHYLKSIGDQQRLYYLEKFVYLLSSINSQTPWYFQTISGLKEAWKHDYTKPYLGDDKKLDIECAESVDLRITALMDYYRKACFDWKYRREVVPKNLRQFKLSVFVYEARIFNNPNSIAASPPDVPVTSGYGGNIQGQAAITNAELVDRLTGKNETANDPVTENVNTVMGVPMSTTRNIFHFDFCEFDMNEGAHLDGLNNMEPAEVKQKFSLTYGDVEETNMYNFWDRNFVSDGFIASLDKLALDDPQPGEPPTQAQKPPIAKADTSLKGSASALQEQAKAKKDKVKADAQTTLDNISGESVEAALATRLKKKVEALASSLFLGNVYGFSAGSLTGAGGAQSLVTKAIDAGSSLLNKSEGSLAGENIFEGSNPTNVTGKPPVDNTSYGPSLTNKDKPSSPNSNIYE